jgi:c-di-GMP-binding flagellar brake protein YcgR
MINFHVTQKIDIIVEGSGKARQIYFSRIEDLGTDTITIAAPYRKGRFLPPWTGRKFSVRVPAEGCAYLFESTLLRTVSDPIALWVIAPPVNIKKVQVRAYVRLPDVLDVTLELLGKEESEGDVITTLTKDISGGGIKVVLNNPLPAGTKLRVILPLPGVGTVVTMGEVVRGIPPEQSGDRPAAAIEFRDIRERDRGNIVKYIFKKQIERRKKENDLFQ